MRLTAYSDYTLRTLIFLALRPDHRATIAEIAGSYRISENHLMKVVHELGRAGLVTTVRGRGGGIVLARPPAEIRLGAVIRGSEPDLHLVECFSAGGSCVIEPGCRLRIVLGEALSAFLAVLDRYTLADLAEPKPALAAVLGIEAA